MKIFKKAGYCLLDFFKKFMGFDYGNFSLNHGKHEVFIATKVPPGSVWIKISGSGFDGCGQLPLNKVSYTLKCGGILFVVKVETAKCSIDWFTAAN